MILSDGEIQEQIEALFPDSPMEHFRNRIQPCSVDLTVRGPLMKVGSPSKPSPPPGFRYLEVPLRPGLSELREVPLDPEEGWVLSPGNLYLLSTEETVAVPNDLLARVDGRSSWARVGLRVHATAGFIDPGFRGRITLELDVAGYNRISLLPGDSICQISFETLGRPAVHPYGTKGSRYQNQDSVTASRGEGT